MPRNRKTYPVPVYAVQLVAERMLDGPVVTGPAGAAKLACEYLANVDREHFVVLLMASTGRITGVNLVAVGSLTSAIVSPRETFKAAILGNAAGILVVHNHPSGNLEPSAEDIAMTRRIAEAGRILDIPLRDSLIVTADGRYTSLAERGFV